MSRNAVSQQSRESGEDIARKQNVILSRIGQSYNFTVKGTRCTEVRPTPRLPGMQAHHSLVNSRLSLATTKICKIWIMLEMEKDESKHRARKWYVARDVDEGKRQFKRT